MNIAYLSDSIIPSAYANAVNVMKMCEAFSNSGHKTTLFARTGNARTQTDYQLYGVQPNFTIVKSWRPKIFTSRCNIKIYLYQLRNKLRRLQTPPDLLYGRDIYSFEALSNLGIPMIYEAHFSPKTPQQIATFRHVFACENFIRLVTVTDFIKNNLIALFPEIVGKVFVAPSATEMPKFSDTTQVIQNWPGDSQNIQVGYVGSIKPGKGMELIFTLAQKALNDHEKIDFHIVGGISKDVQKWQSNSKKIRNIFFHGFVAHKDLDLYYKHFDVLLAPYSIDYNEGTSPLKIAEYMARQKPIIASDVPLVRTMLCHNESALLVNPNNPAAWLTSIEKAATNKELSVMLTKNAYAEFLMNYNWENRAKNVLNGLS